MITVEDVVWAAGFLEGEGTFIVAYSPRVQAAQASLPPLEKIKTLFGGTIAKKKRYKGTHTQAYVWTISGDGAVILMKLIYPYMSSRRQAQIESAIRRDQRKSRMTTKTI